MEWENLYAFYYYSKFYPVGYLKIVSKFNKSCAKVGTDCWYRVVWTVGVLIGVFTVSFDLQ